MKAILVLLFIALICYFIWAVKIISDCKRNNLTIKEKVTDLWSNPFWIGPEKFEPVRKKVFVILGSVCLGIYIIYHLSSLSNIDEVITFLSNTFIHSTSYLFVLLFLTLFLCRHSLKQRFVVALVELYFIVCIFRNKGYIGINTSLFLIPAFIFLLIANELKTEKIIKIHFILTFVLFASVSVLFAAGKISSGDWTTLASRGSESGWLSMRYALGFVHPNTAGIILAVTVVMWFVIRSEKIKWYDWVIFVIAAAVITIVIDSRGALLLLLVFAFTFILFKYLPKLYDCKIIKYSAISLPAVCTVISFICALFYNDNNSVWNKINNLSTGRLYLMKEFLAKYKFSFLGQITEKSVDNTYLCTFVQNGILVMAVIIPLYCLLIKRLWNKKATAELSLVLSYMVYYLIEDGILLITLNISLYLLSDLILFKPESEQQLLHKEKGKISSQINK